MHWNNSLFVIHPYKEQGQWMFDDESVGLFREPFVAGADTLMERISKEQFGGADKLTLIFSEKPIPNATVVLEIAETVPHNPLQPQEYGTDYHYEGEPVWLCPALNKYFPESPKEIWISAKRREE
jgi:hypothetical protein